MKCVHLGYIKKLAMKLMCNFVYLGCIKMLAMKLALSWGGEFFFFYIYNFHNNINNNKLTKTVCFKKSII